MSLRSLVRGIVGGRSETPRMESASGGAAQQLIPPDATIARLRRFSLNHGLRSVDGLVGEHRSRRRGAAPEFSDYAPYTPGDDVRRIDWNAYARFDTLYVRESEITTELDVHVLVDTSASMDWSGDRNRDTKLQTARKVASLVCWIALARSDRVSITSVTDKPGETFGPLQGRGMVVPAATHLSGLDGGGESSLAAAVETYVLGRPRSGFLIVLSDLIGVSADAFDHALATLSNNRWRAVVVHIEDPLESDPGGLGAVHDVLEIEDPETGMRQRINLRADTLQRYARDRDSWLADLLAMASKRSVPMLTVGTDSRIDPDVLMELERSGVITS